MELTREIRDRRVAVMRDVVKQIDRADKPLKLKRGMYLEGDMPAGWDLPGDADLGDVADEIQAHCEVCMLGSAFLSLARVFDNIPTSVAAFCQWDDGGYLTVGDLVMRERLIEIFDDHTLRLMEVAFELSTSFIVDEEEEADIPDGLMEIAKAACRFGAAHLNSPRDRARAIATNIIDHDGELVIPAPPHAGPGGDE